MANAKPPRPTSPASAEPDIELTDTLSETARILFSATTMGDTLQQVVELGVTTVEGCDYAGIFLVSGDTVTTPAHTHPVVRGIDAIQRRTAQGPCLDVIARGASVYADDLAEETRWPQFAPAATSVGIRSALALGLAANSTRGALNLYGRYPQAFGILDRAKATVLATLAGIALSAAEAREEEAARTANLRSALVTREMIGRAEGILIERERISGEQAFDILRRASQHLNIKLREVARTFIETGERPDTGMSPPSR